MAKRVHSVALKGILLDGNIIEELGKKTDDPSEFFSLLEILEEFRGKNVAITIKEEQSVDPDGE